MHSLAAYNTRIKINKKRMAFRGKHPPTGGLINNVGKRTVVLLIPSSLSAIVTELKKHQCNLIELNNQLIEK